MIYLLIIINSILTYSVIYFYYKFKDWVLDRKIAFKIIILNNILLLLSSYIFYRLFPNNCFGDLFDPNQYFNIINNNQRFINTIGETVFSSEPPF